MVELSEETSALDSATIGIYRTATVVKGGRRFSWGSLVVVGDRRGNIGIGYGKAPNVPGAIEKALKEAKKRIFGVTLKEGTIPHPVVGKFGASRVTLVPAAPGTGVIAGGTVRAVLEMAGVRDCLTKATGSTNQKNLCKAAINGLQELRSKEEIAELRGVEIQSSAVDEILAAGERYAPVVKKAGSRSTKKGDPAASGDQTKASDSLSEDAGSSISETPSETAVVSSESAGAGAKDGGDPSVDGGGAVNASEQKDTAGESKEG